MSTKYYTLDEINKIKAQYYMIFGERSNGKSYAVKMEILKNFYEKGKEFVICKRYDEDMKTKTCASMFNDLEEYVLEKYNQKIKFYRGQWLSHDANLEGKLSECTIMGHAISISGSEKAKMSQYPKVTTIVFEEFMSINAIHIPQELNLFINLVSTIVRDRLDCKIYMLGNAISKHSLYADALGVRLHRMKKGDIIVKKFENKKGYKTTFAIQRTENVDVFDNEKNEDKIVYNVFGDSGVGSMITTGDFETGIYNLTINDITLSENIGKIPPKKYTIVNKNHSIPFFIRYEDYYYKMYLVDIDNKTLAFREVDNIDNVKNAYIFNNKDQINNCINIKNIVRYYTKDKYLDKMLEIIINCLYQDNTVFTSNECGEDVYNAFRLCGMRI